MTIYPLTIQLGRFEITGYGIMMMVAFLVGGWLISLELRRRGLREEYAGDIVAAAVVGGIVGAKLWYVALFRDPSALFSRGGLVWYGGFIGASWRSLQTARGSRSRRDGPCSWALRLLLQRTRWGE